MQKFIAAIVVLVSAGFALVAPAAPLPRQSPEFAIVAPGGATILLSSLKGKVVVVEFLFVKSEHCLRVIRMLEKLRGELGSRGFQPVGVVFDPPNSPVEGRLQAAQMTRVLQALVSCGLHVQGGRGQLSCARAERNPEYSPGRCYRSHGYDPGDDRRQKRGLDLGRRGRYAQPDHKTARREQLPRRRREITQPCCRTLVSCAWHRDACHGVRRMSLIASEPFALWRERSNSCKT